ncbi:jg4488, partial [Pararge aegeria aegeria]
TIRSTDRHPLMDIGLLKGVPNSVIMVRLYPAAPRNSFDIVCPPGWGSTDAALTGAGLPLQHVGTPTSVGSPS